MKDNYQPFIRPQRVYSALRIAILTSHVLIYSIQSIDSRPGGRCLPDGPLVDGQTDFRAATHREAHAHCGVLFANWEALSKCLWAKYGWGKQTFSFEMKNFIMLRSMF